MSISTKRFKRRGPRLYAPNGRVMEFPHQIEQLLDCGSVAVVRLDPSAGDARNVYGVDRRGRMVWRLRRSPFTGGNCRDPYVALHQYPKVVVVSSFCGQVYEIDRRTGRTVHSSWTK